MNLKFKTQQITNQIIEWSEDNSSGLIMSEHSIKTLTRFLLFHSIDLYNDSIDELMGQLESEIGYLIKASDFRNAIELIIN